MRVYLCVILCGLGCFPAKAGVVIESLIDIAGQAKQKTKVFLEGRDMRIEMGSEKPAQRYLIFRGREEKVWVVDATQKTYTVLDKKTLKQVNDQLLGLVDFLQKNPTQAKVILEAMPAEQRKQAEYALGHLKRPAYKASSSLQFKKLGSNQTVGKWKCNRYAEVSEPLFFIEFCAVPYEKLGLKTTDVSAFSGIKQLLKGSAFETFGDSISMWSVDQLKLGFPVETKLIEKKTKTLKSVTQVLSIEKQPITTALLEISPDLKSVSVSPTADKSTDFLGSKIFPQSKKE